jgi:hypothetical protein
MKAYWTAFFVALFHRLLSPQTARFILALLSLGAASYGANELLKDGDQEASQAAVFAVGQLFGLAVLAFTYYFGSTAKRDDENPKVEIEQPPGKPVPTTDETQGDQA